MMYPQWFTMVTIMTAHVALEDSRSLTDIAEGKGGGRPWKVIDPEEKLESTDLKLVLQERGL